MLLYFEKSEGNRGQQINCVVLVWKKWWCWWLGLFGLPTILIYAICPLHGVKYKLNNIMQCPVGVLFYASCIILAQKKLLVASVDQMLSKMYCKYSFLMIWSKLIPLIFVFKKLASMRNSQLAFLNSQILTRKLELATLKFKLSTRNSQNRLAHYNSQLANFNSQLAKSICTLYNSQILTRNSQNQLASYNSQLANFNSQLAKSTHKLQLALATINSQLVTRNSQIIQTPKTWFSCVQEDLWMVHGQV